IARYGHENLSGALEDFDEALAGSPEDVDSLSFRALTKLRLGQFEPAEDDRTQLGVVAPNGAAEIGVRGALHLVQGGGDAAAELAEASNKDGGWFSWLGLAHLRAGRLEEAKEAYRKRLATALPGD